MQTKAGYCLGGVVELEVALVLNGINVVEVNLKQSSVIDEMKRST